MNCGLQLQKYLNTFQNMALDHITASQSERRESLFHTREKHTSFEAESCLKRKIVQSPQFHQSKILSCGQQQLILT